MDLGTFIGRTVTWIKRRCERRGGDALPVGEPILWIECSDCGQAWGEWAGGPGICPYCEGFISVPYEGSDDVYDPHPSLPESPPLSDAPALGTPTWRRRGQDRRSSS